MRAVRWKSLAKNATATVKDANATVQGQYLPASGLGLCYLSRPLALAPPLKPLPSTLAPRKNWKGPQTKRGTWGRTKRNQIAGGKWKEKPETTAAPFCEPTLKSPTNVTNAKILEGRVGGSEMKILDVVSYL